jgi:uncharacterized protein YbjQ (UPF0145 family)
MILTNTSDIVGYKLTETLGVVRGSSVRAKWFGADIASAFKNLTGGELNKYQELLTQARETAIERMTKDAEELNADAIVNLRFMTSQIAQGAAEILVYGTAVKIKKIKK